MPKKVIGSCNGSNNQVLVGGLDPRLGALFTYYETIGGGFGARPSKDGIDGIHCHRTNTKNTPVEAVEIAYPLMVEEYSLIAGTGGAGQFRGGNGIRRAVRILMEEGDLSIISNRRSTSPFGILGGKDGRRGRNLLRQADGKIKRLPARIRVPLKKGDVVIVETPGGGGYGPPEKRAVRDIKKDLREEKITLNCVKRDYPKQYACLKNMGRSKKT